MMMTKRNQSGIKKNCQIQINLKNKTHGKIKTKTKIKNKKTGLKKLWGKIKLSNMCNFIDYKPNNRKETYVKEWLLKHFHIWWKIPKFQGIPSMLM